jgi:hypothetical protein
VASENQVCLVSGKVSRAPIGLPCFVANRGYLCPYFPYFSLVFRKTTELHVANSRRGTIAARRFALSILLNYFMLSGRDWYPEIKLDRTGILMDVNQLGVCAGSDPAASRL